METLDLEENRIQYTVLRLRGKSLADENYHFHVVFPKSCCASLASLLCGATKVKEFAANSIITGQDGQQITQNILGEHKVITTEQQFLGVTQGDIK